MKVIKFSLPILLSVFLCACGSAPTTTAYQPITVQNDIPKVSAKPKTTEIKETKKPTAEIATVSQAEQPQKEVKATNSNNTTSNSAIKDVIIDGFGNLVVQHSNGTFTTFPTLKGDKGDMGAKGDKGDRGEQGIQGEQGERGADGRGIAYCELDDDKNLIIHYTDDTTQNVGNLLYNKEPTTHDYEQVGYIVKNINNSSKYDYETYGCHYGDYLTSYVINNVKLELININNNNPSRKYEYKLSLDYSEIVSSLNVSNFVFSIDNSVNIAVYFYEEQGSYTEVFYSSIPYVQITDFYERAI